MERIKGLFCGDRVNGVRIPARAAQENRTARLDVRYDPFHPAGNFAERRAQR